MVFRGIEANSSVFGFFIEDVLQKHPFKMAQSCGGNDSNGSKVREFKR
jgi:hypothetical protein